MSKSNSQSPTPEKVQRIDRDTCRKIAEAIDEALKSVSERFGLSIQPSRGSYGSTNVKFTVEAAVIGEDGAAITPELKDLKGWLHRQGYEESVAGSVGEVPKLGPCKLVGYNYRAPKYPFLVEQVETGTVYKYAREIIKCFVSPEAYAAAQSGNLA